ncbi:Holliday junction resolvase RuvX [Candidatus Kaiserbacteria bacterium]|nr:MAG: Holliday junction resolvase RuvX [Candidatus Kaiserbacteria bacterium]
MKYLGVDYGSKKVGLAFSDDGGSLAFPHSVLPNDEALFDTVKELIEVNGVEALVIGHSLAMDGSENPIMGQAHAFKDIFEQSGLHVYLEPEFLTTFQAKRNTEDAMADAAAAALILQSFLDKKQNEA